MEINVDPFSLSSLVKTVSDLGSFMESLMRHLPGEIISIAAKHGQVREAQICDLCDLLAGQRKFLDLSHVLDGLHKVGVVLPEEKIIGWVKRACSCSHYRDGAIILCKELVMTRYLTDEEVSRFTYENAFRKGDHGIHRWFAVLVKRIGRKRVRFSGGKIKVLSRVFEPIFGWGDAFYQETTIGILLEFAKDGLSPQALRLLRASLCRLIDEFEKGVPKQTAKLRSITTGKRGLSHLVQSLS